MFGKPKKEPEAAIKAEVQSAQIGESKPQGEVGLGVKDILAAKLQVDIEVIAMVAETHAMVKELYEQNKKGG